MGDPRRLRKKVVGPRHPFDKERLEQELPMMGIYGLRNKKEIRRALTSLRRFRSRSRQMLALPSQQRAKEEAVLIKKLHSLALIPENATLDEVLSLTVDDFLKRRLQTVVHELGLAYTPHQARQMIVHGHISINKRRVTIPGYHVRRGEEKLIEYSNGSPFADEGHDIHQQRREAE
ncbi:MAG: 30S ribosomal protein S4 [Candidatus Hodarchaeota archaeon]